MIACVLIFHLNCTILLLSPGNILRPLRATNVVCFKLENWYAGEGAWVNSLQCSVSIIKNYSYDVYKRNFYINISSKGTIKATIFRNPMMKLQWSRGRFIPFFLVLKISQVSLNITAAHVLPLYNKNMSRSYNLFSKIYDTYIPGVVSE